MIRVCNLEKSFGENSVLHGIDLETKKGEIVVDDYEIYMQALKGGEAR